MTIPTSRRSEPLWLRSWLPRGALIAGGALAGLGLIFWIAANWAGFGRFGRLAVIELAFLAACVAGWRFPLARSAAGIVALLSIGALLACLGQTYQTGADSWQLFALWAGLALPLCLGLRSPALWTPWTVVAMACIARLMFLHGGPGHAGAMPLGAAGAFAIAFALAPRWQRQTGGGVWPFRAALLQAVCLVLVMGLVGLFARPPATDYWIGLAILAAVAAWLYRPHRRDIAGLCAAALAIDILLVCGVARLVLDHAASRPVTEMLLIAAAAIASLSLTAHLLKGVRQ